MSLCEICDVEGPTLPPGPLFTSYEFLEAHRAWHGLGRQLAAVLTPIVEWLSRRLP